MEKFYIVKCDDYLKAIEKDKAVNEARSEFVKDFYTRHEIDDTSYYFGGNGGVNKPFGEWEKDSISLMIEATEKNIEKFGPQFKNAPIDGMRAFRKNSVLLKEFQDECVAKQIIVNIYETRTGDYFKGLEYGGYTHQRFVIDGVMYLRIHTDSYGGKEFEPIKQGFEEIKASDYYLEKERYERGNGLSTE